MTEQVIVGAESRRRFNQSILQEPQQREPHIPRNIIPILVEERVDVKLDKAPDTTGIV